MAKKLTSKQRALVCLLLLLYLVVANLGYNIWTAKPNTSIRKLLTASAIYDLWMARRRASSQYGMVLGILFHKNNPKALIGYRVAHEGEEVHGVKILKIHKKKVDFEKNGQTWTQTVQEYPNQAWKG